MSKSVIVIGGGLSGRETVKSLVALKKAKKLDASVTLVEASPTYESDLGMPNGITDAGIEKVREGEGGRESVCVCVCVCVCAALY